VLATNSWGRGSVKHNWQKMVDVNLSKPSSGWVVGVHGQKGSSDVKRQKKKTEQPVVEIE